MTTAVPIRRFRFLTPVFAFLLLSAFTAPIAFAARLGTIPQPPPGAKLRIFVKALDGEREGGTWGMAHKKFEKSMYKNIERVIADGSTYVVVPEKDVKRVLGEKELTLWKWWKNDWHLAVEAGKRLYAEYTMVIVRNWNKSDGLDLRFYLINVETGKIFSKVLMVPRMADRKKMVQMFRATLNELDNEAADDLIATANRKGQAVSQELIETKKEILALMADTPPKTPAQTEAKAPAPPEKETPAPATKLTPPPSQKETPAPAARLTPPPSQKETPAPAARLTPPPSQKETPVAAVPNKPAKTSPKEKPAAPLSAAAKTEKVVQLEKRLASLLATIEQLEVMKKQFEDHKKKSARLTRELAEREKREKTLLARLEDSAKSPPVIVLATPKDKATVEFDFIHLAGVVEDEKGIQTLEFFLNDAPLSRGAERGLAVAKRKDIKRREFKQRISLVKGVNRLKIRAVDSDGLAAEKTLTVTYEEKQKKMRAVIVGIDKYPNIRQLQYAVNDARIFYDHLVGHNRIPEENITLLLDQDATLRKIRSALGTQLKNKAAKDDMVIIYFAGHGATERDAQSPDGDGLEKYLLPYDADLSDLYATALPMEELSRIFGRIRSERLIYIADACYSGASGGRTIGVTGTRASLSDAFMDRIAGGKGRVIITASGANEVSAENETFKHGVFTYYLIEGLKGPADVDKDGLVSVDEAYDYVSEHVPNATNQEQHPVKKGSVEGQLIISIVE